VAAALVRSRVGDFLSVYLDHGDVRPIFPSTEQRELENISAATAGFSAIAAAAVEDEARRCSK
jgi:hypothetical protein